MKVLLLCMAFAAVSVAMPVAEEVAESASAVGLTAEKQPQFDAQPAPVIADVIKPEIKEENALEPEANSEVLDKKPAVEEAAKSEPEKTPEPVIANPAEETIVEKVETKPDTEVKQDETTAVVQEIPNVAVKSAPSDDAIGMMNMNTDAKLAEDAIVPVPMPEKKLDLPVEPSKDNPTENVDAAAEKPVKPEDKKEETKTVEKASEPTPGAPEEPKNLYNGDSLRAIRDTADEPTSPVVEPVKLNEVKDNKVVEEVKKPDENSTELPQAEPTKASETAADAQPTPDTQPKVDNTKEAVTHVTNNITEKEMLADPHKNSSEENSGSDESNESGEKNKDKKQSSSEEGGTS